MVINTLRKAVAAGREAVAEPAPKAQTVRVAWAFILLEDFEIAGDSASDSAGDIAGNGLQDHQRFCEQSGYRCLVIANRFPPVLLERPEVIYEFVPLDLGAAADRGIRPDMAQRYTVMRLQHIVAFWQVIGCTWSGGRSGEVRRHAAKLITAPSVLTTKP